MSEIDDLVRRAIDTVTAIARTAARFATRVLLFTLVVCVGGFLLGVAALSDGARTVWIVLGIVFGSIAIGGAFVARWRVGSVRRHVPELADEIRSLIGQGQGAGRTVVETFVVDNDVAGGPSSPGGDAPGSGSAIVLTRRMYGFRDAVGSGLESSARLSAAVTALTSFPALILAAIAISFVFGFLGFFFLIALAL